ncbi:MAG: hypothetical protein ACLR7Z_01040 [Bilophila wadsworthia]
MLNSATRTVVNSRKPITMRWIAASRGLGQERREKGQEQFHGQRP